MENRGIPYRELGTTGERVSVLGIGGFHVGVPDDPEIATQIIRQALDSGVNFLDNSWDYHAGESERRMGQALQGGYRGRAFLMTKLDSRSYDGTMRQVEESLERLQTDHVDLLQLHEVVHDDDAERAFAPNGAIKAYLELRDQGVTRYIGFTGHKSPEIHLRMLHAAIAHDVHFDTVQMPINIFDAGYLSFRNNALPVAVEHGVGVIGMKSLGSGDFVAQSDWNPADLLRWAMSQPVSVVVTGCEWLRDLEQGLEVARRFEPMSEGDAAELEAKAVEAAEPGVLEAYKSSLAHDSTTKNPQWMV